MVWKMSCICIRFSKPGAPFSAVSPGLFIDLDIVSAANGGAIRTFDVISACRTTTVLVSIMLANNEVGLHFIFSPHPESFTVL